LRRPRRQQAEDWGKLTIEAPAVTGFMSKMARWQPKNMFTGARFAKALLPASWRMGKLTIEAPAVTGFMSKMARWQPKNMFTGACFATAR